MSKLHTVLMERNCFLFFLAVMLVHCLIACSAKPVTNIATDQSALLALKAQINFDPHNVLANNWSTTSSICNWIGITCDIRHQRVTALDISDMGLSGSIPPNLGNLSFLVSFKVSQNSFRGHLPQELAHLHQLKFMNLGINNFSGEVPSWLGALPQLQVLVLANNSFTGTIPPSLSNISKLETLNLDFNFLRGKIPQDIGNLHNLKVLSMGGNQLSGIIPPTVFNISSLQSIVFAINSLTGILPMDTCYRLSKLERLHLSVNKLYGQIPSSLHQCSKLQILYLSYNKFSGPIPREIGNLTTLKQLALGGNNFRGEIPQEMGNLLSLELLAMENARLTGLIPSSIFNITSLTMLYFHLNNLTGVLPQEIGNLRNLEQLILDYNSLRGPIPEAIFNISKLKLISIVGNHLSGSLPSSIGLRVLNLEGLYLGLNNLSGLIPDCISNASKLSHLDLYSNQFTGSIPNSLGNLRLLEILGLGRNNFTSDSSLSFLTSLTNCKHLRILWIGNNPLNGILPASIGNLSTSLESFTLTYCGIKGNIPKEIGNLSNLGFLYLHGNDLTGFIPTTLKGLQKLQIFSIGDNRIQGTIPNDLCHLPQLGWIYFSKMELSGPVPACLGNISSLRYLYLDSNRLTSTIPSTLGSLKDLLEFNLSSNFLNGYLPLEIGNLKVVTLIDVSMNQFSGGIPGTIGGLQDLVILSLAYNRLQGYIPESFGKLISLEFFDLSHNNLSSTIPKSLEALLHLKYFNVSFNRLRGEIPNGGPFSNFTDQSFMSNEALCGAPRLHVPPCHTTIHKSSKKRVLLVIYILLPIASIMLAVTFAFVSIRWRRTTEVPTQTNLLHAIAHGRITYQELRQATDGFSESNLLGMGSFGSVYKGTLIDGTILAIKVFNLQLEGAFKSFDTECEILRNIRHRNLTKVLSSCSNLDFKALVLEYMHNGSLEKWLYSHNYCLDILQRLDIMVDVAYALDYLHHGYSTPLVHCDLKPSNVLLDEDMVAHVSDFGIARFLCEGESIAQTKTLATVGYIAPEYGMEGLVSTRCDVYSYGIMLMETFTRRKPTDEIFARDLSLKGWVNDSLPNTITQIIDANLLRPEEGDLTAKVQCVASIMELALNCSTESPQERISMRAALPALKKIRLRFLANSRGTT